MLSVFHTPPPCSQRCPLFLPLFCPASVFTLSSLPCNLFHSSAGSSCSVPWPCPCPFRSELLELLPDPDSCIAPFLSQSCLPEGFLTGSQRTEDKVSLAKQPDLCTQVPYWQHLPRGKKRESILNLKILHVFQMSWMYSPVSCDYHFAACCWLPKSHANRLQDVGSVKNTLPHVQLEPSIIPYKSSSKKWKREVIIIFNINSNY